MPTRPFALLAALAAVTSGCTPECGRFTFTLPETTAFYTSIGEPDLIHPSQAAELCGTDLGSQGNWNVKPDETLISFEPSAARAGTFSDLLLTVAFRTSAATEGATLTGTDLGGQGLTGLSLQWRDVAPLVPTSTLTFHRIGAELEEEVFNRRVVELSWDLTWENGAGSRYTAKGRDSLDLYVDKR